MPRIINDLEERCTHADDEPCPLVAKYTAKRNALLLKFYREIETFIEIFEKEIVAKQEYILASKNFNILHVLAVFDEAQLRVRDVRERVEKLLD